jgi:cytosol alanyl aminopeptidase
MRGVSSLLLVSLLLFPWLWVTSCASTSGPPQDVTTAAAPTTNQSVEVAPTFLLPTHTKPVRQRVELTLDPARDDYTGTTLIDIDMDAPRTRFWLHAKDLVIDESSAKASATDIAKAGEGASQAVKTTIIQADQGMLQVELPTPMQHLQLRLRFHAAFHPDPIGLFRVDHEGARYLFTDLEPTDARRVVPCFDEPRFKIPLELTVHAPSNLVVVGNEVVATATTTNTITTTILRTTKPLPPYLWAFAVGPFDVVKGAQLPSSALRPYAVNVTGYAPKGHGARMQRMLQWQGEAALFAERSFGVPFPYEKIDAVAVPGFGGGGMENAGLITYRDARVFVDADSSALHQRGVVELVAHEVAHQFFGDMVTLASWDDVWLNEGFATWFGGVTAQAVAPTLVTATRARERLQHALHADWWSHARRVQNPVQHAGDIESAFDSISYQKGASLLAMFQRSIDAEHGDGAFVRAVGGYLSTHAHGLATSDDFLRALPGSASIDFRSFLTQAGAPILDVTLACDGAGNRALVHQARAIPAGVEASPAQWSLPLCMSSGMLGKAAADHPRTTTCSHVAATTTVVPLSAPSPPSSSTSSALPARCPQWLLPQDGGTGYHRFSVDAKMLRLLVAAREQLTTVEQMSLMTAVQTGVMTGQVPLVDAVALGAAFVDAAPASLSLAAGHWLLFAADELADDKQRKKIEQRIAQLYRPVFDTVGFVARANDTPDDEERRVGVLRLLLDANDAVTTKKAVALGQKVAETGQTTVAVDVRSLILGAYFGEAKEDVWRAGLQRALGFSDSLQRADWLQGLSMSRLPARTAEVVQAGLDARVRHNEKTLLLVGQLRRPTTRAFAVPALLSSLPRWRAELSSSAFGRLPRLLVVGCDDASLPQAQAAFAADVAAVPALAKSLSLMQEEVHACAVRKALHAPLANRLW